jgi:Yip1 domain
MTDPRSSLPGVPPSLVDRVKNLLMTPKTEWPKIDAEPATVQGLFTGYVMLLAAIPAIATAIGLFLFVPRGVVVAGIGVSFGITTTSIIASAVISYVLSLVSVYVMGLIIDGLAPSFGSTKDQLKAMKVAAYYPTAAWVAGIGMLVPGIGGLVLLVGGVYSLYLLYLGLPVLMKTPADKQVSYFVVTLIVAIIVLGIINTIGTRIAYGGYF